MFNSTHHISTRKKYWWLSVIYSAVCAPINSLNIMYFSITEGGGEIGVIRGNTCNRSWTFGKLKLCTNIASVELL